jgi:hypothetical protein
VKIPTEEDLRAVAKLGYSWPRLAARYDIGINRMKTICRQWPEIERQIIHNGKIRTANQKSFGNYLAGGF